MLQLQMYIMSRRPPAHAPKDTPKIDDLHRRLISLSLGKRGITGGAASAQNMPSKINNQKGNNGPQIKGGGGLLTWGSLLEKGPFHGLSESTSS